MAEGKGQKMYPLRIVVSSTWSTQVPGSAAGEPVACQLSDAKGKKPFQTLELVEGLSHLPTFSQ